MVKRLLMVLVVVAGALIVPVLTSSPAAAADTACSVNEAWRGPYWWGGVDATNKSGSRKVLAVSSPWQVQSYMIVEAIEAARAADRRSWSSPPPRASTPRVSTAQT